MHKHSTDIQVLESPMRTAAVQAAQHPSRQHFLHRVAQAMPTLLVLGSLAALAGWGHSVGWRLPRFAELVGNGEAAADDWCSAHAVPETICVECKPGLLPKGKEFGWCKVHGIPECPLEHPEVAQLTAVPSISAAVQERALRALAFAPRPENNPKCKLHLRRIQFATQQAAENAGVEVEPAWLTRMEESVTAPGEVIYDQTRVARVSARAPGAAWQVTKQVGDRVRRGEVLALIDAAEVGRAKAEFLQALVQLDLKRLILANLRAATGAVPERQLQEAEAAASEGQIRLLTAQQALINLGLPLQAEEFAGLRSEEIASRVRLLGVPDAIARTLDAKSVTANLLPLRAPLDGVVVAREVVAGEVVDTARALFTVADLSQMWLTLSFKQADAPRLALGQPVRFRTEGQAGEMQGAISWISTEVDEKTRTVKVRADLANPASPLRANTFGTGRVILREEPEAVVVPNDALHWEGDCHVVFVRDKGYDPRRPDSLLFFHPRKVRPGAKTDLVTEVIAGILPGELIASRGSGVLRSELLKNNLGAG